MVHFLDVCNFSLEKIMEIILKAVEIKAEKEKFLNCVKGKILGTMFFEPSTRTRLSFQAAMVRLGGQVLDFGGFKNSSIAKGENFRDSVKIMSEYVDIIALRHFCEGAGKAASLFSSCPIINSGDGSHCHPTQTLTDLFTIFEQKGSLENLTICFCGDLKYGRTVHSLVETLNKFRGNRFVFISTSELKIPKDFKKAIVKSKNEYFESEYIEDFLTSLDVIYMTRIQRERFKNLDLYLDQNRKSLKLSLNLIEKTKKDLIVLHPLPRVDEISYEVDFSPKAKYFEQARNGIFVRMALIYKILDGSFLFSSNECLKFSLEEERCKNENCIVNFEKYLPKYFTYIDEIKRCYYCNGEVYKNC